jgi:hypothetical protein
MVLFILGEMSLSGGGTVETYYQLTSYAVRVVEMKRNTREEMRPYLLLSYFSPVLLVFGIAFMGAVLTSFSTRIQPGQAALRLLNLQIGALPPELFQVANLVVVVSSAALGIIGAKMIDFTVKNTLRASLNVVIAVVAAYAVAAINLASVLHLGA